MNRRELLRIGMKAILVAPLVAIGIKALPEKEEISRGEWETAIDIPITVSDDGPEIWIDGGKSSNFVARVQITFEDGKGVPSVYKWEYLDENEL